MTNKIPPTQLTMNKSRFEAFSDGVFAIVITLLVIEIHVPDLKGSVVNNTSLIEGLEYLLPTFLSYFLSVAVVSMFWLSHHYMYHFHAKTIDRIIIQMNVVFLGFMALIPFSANFLAVYPNQPVAVAWYGANIFVVSCISLIIYRYIWTASHIENGDVPIRQKKQVIIRTIITVGTSLIGIFMAFVNVNVAIGIYILAVIFNTIPGLLNLCERIFGFKIK